MESFNNFIETIWTDEKLHASYSQRAKKQFDQIFHELGHTPSQVLNFTGGALSTAMAHLGCDVVEPADKSTNKVDTIFALDEYFCINDPQPQFDLIKESVSTIAEGGILFASVRDYRNNPIHKRRLGDAASLSANGNSYIIVEAQTPDETDRQAWTQTNFVITNGQTSEAYEIGNRHTLYFKQLAKYCNDLGCKQFGVLNDHFWRAPWRRQMEHIAWARF